MYMYICIHVYMYTNISLYIYSSPLPLKKSVIGAGTVWLERLHLAHPAAHGDRATEGADPLSGSVCYEGGLPS